MNEVKYQAFGYTSVTQPVEVQITGHSSTLPHERRVEGSEEPMMMVIGERFGKEVSEVISRGDLFHSDVACLE